MTGRDSSGRSADELAETDLADTPGRRDAVDALLEEVVAPPPREPAAGDWIGRFQILRPLGRGGFGLVYEARDRDLGRRVAVKVVRVERAAASVAALLALFKNEAEAAAHLNHPNIVTIHDFGTHEDMPYVILELLEGETLQQRAERGPVPPREALAIMVQVARGLAHAHAAGVIHRDIKPANVFLRRDGQVKVLDFGLAGFMGAMATLRTPGAGTPAYMAPEQWRGRGEDARADVFSAGVVLFQLLAGKLPFHVTDGRRSDLERPPTEAELREGLAGCPRPLARVAMRALANDPADRFADAAALLRELEALAAPRARRAPLVLLAAALVAAAVALLAWPRRAPPPGWKPGDGRRTVAVLGFANEGSDAARAWVGPTLTEMLGTELSSAVELRLVPRDDVQRARREITTAGPEALRSLRAALGADLVVVGSYAAGTPAGALTVDLVVKDTASGETVVTLAVPGDQGDVVALAATLGTLLRERLGLRPLAPAVAAQLRAAMPVGSAAARAYAEAVSRMRDHECTPARELLVAAVAADPRFALAHSALAEAEACLGFDAPAREAARRAYDLSSELPRKERLWIEAQYWQLSGSPRRALDVVRTLWALAPDDLDVGLRLVRFYGPDARLALAALRNLPPPLSDSPRIDLAALGGPLFNASYEEALALARRAQEKARASGSRALLAEAYQSEASSLVRMGRAAEAERAARQVIELAHSVGNESLAIDAALIVGMARLSLNEVAAAAAMVEEAAAAAHAIGDGERYNMAIQRLSRIYLKSGDLARARARAEELSTWCAGRQRLGGMTVAAAMLAEAHLGLGDARQARKSLDQALSLGASAQRSDVSAAGQGLDPQQFPYEVPFAEGDLAGGTAALERALAAATRLGAVAAAATYLVTLGYHDLDVDPARAAGEAQRALALLEKLPGGARELEALARAVGAAAVTLQPRGDHVQALIELARAEPTLEATEWLRAHVWGRILSARARAAAGEPATPARLEELLPILDAKEQVALAFEVRLELGQLELAAGRRGQARARLTALAREAAARGFARVAREAERAARSR